MAQSPLALAVETPRIVYALSSLPPSVMFEFGFESYGTDADLMRYAADSPAFNHRSAYIPTLGTYEAVLDIARRSLEFSPNLLFYIYALRPTNNFYSVQNSLDYARYHLTNPEAREQAAALMRDTPRTHEWAALGNISGEQIMSAREVYWENGTVATGDYTVNLNYIYLPPVTNPNPMPMRNASVEAVNVAEQAQSVFFLPGSVNDMGCHKPSQQLSASRTDVCPPLTRLSFGQLRTKFIGRLLAVGLLSGSTSGQLLSVPGTTNYENAFPIWQKFHLTS